MSQTLRKLLLTNSASIAADFSRRSDYWRRQTRRLEILFKFKSNKKSSLILAKILAHSPDGPIRWNATAVKNWWTKHSPRAFPNGEESLLELDRALGRGRQLPIVVRFDADGQAEDTHPIQKFNLPSAPLVLISTPKGQEGIDLHRYCRRVVLYDLTWNPAHMEQRIGRVHRLGGGHSIREKIEVVYCYQEGTYEEIMAQRVEARCKMLRVLLGAGQWLDESKEIEDVERYQMSFPP